MLLIATFVHAANVTTPLMGLNLPTPGPGGTTGPMWASMLNTAFQGVDAHNHSTGKGAKVPVAGLNMNADLSFGGYNGTDFKSTRYTSQGSTLVGASDKNAVYSVNGDLYWNNASGTAVKITSGTGINAASIGGIGGDYATSTASVSYSDALKSFSFTQASGVTAKMTFGDFTLFENVAGTQGITFKSPTSLASAYSLTMPAALPASTQPISVSSAGVLSAGQIVTAQITDANVTTAKIADSNVTTAKILDANVTTAKILNGNITHAKMAPRGTVAQVVGVGGIAVSPACVSFATTSVTPVDVTNLSVTITTIGRPVRVELVANIPFSINPGIYSSKTGTGITGGMFSISRDATPVDYFYFDQEGDTSSPSYMAMPASSVSTTDIVAEGTHTYKVHAAANYSSTTINVYDVKLVAYEL